MVRQRLSRTGAVLALVLASVSCEAGDAAPEFSYGTDSEALAVYSVVIPVFLSTSLGPVVLDAQTTFSYDHDGWARCYDVVRAPATLAPSLWRSLPLANSSSVALEPTAAAALAPELVVAEVDQRDVLWAAGYFGPSAFTEAYPGRSLLRVSRVAFSPDEREALVYVWRISNGCGNGAVFALARAGNEWSITFQSGLGAS